MCDRWGVLYRNSHCIRPCGEGHYMLQPPIASRWRSQCCKVIYAVNEIHYLLIGVGLKIVQTPLLAKKRKCCSNWKRCGLLEIKTSPSLKASSLLIRTVAPLTIRRRDGSSCLATLCSIARARRVWSTVACSWLMCSILWSLESTRKCWTHFNCQKLSRWARYWWSAAQLWIC